MADEKKWIYRTNFDHKMCIRPSSQEIKKDQLGNDIVYKHPAVMVKFVNQLLVVDENLAKVLKLPVETVQALVEADNTFGRSVFCIHSPDKSASAEEVAAIDEQTKQATRGPKVRQGSRGLDRTR